MDVNGVQDEYCARFVRGPPRRQVPAPSNGGQGGQERTGRGQRYYVVAATTGK